MFNAGAYADAEKQAHQLISQYPNSGFLWKVLGAALQAQGKDPLSAMIKAAELLPDDAEAHNNLGNFLLLQGQLEEAVASLRKVVAIMPELAEVHNRLGGILLMLQQFEEAVSSCRQALKLKPDFAQAHINLGIALQELGKLEDAEESFRRAIRINPEYASAHNNLGIVLHKLEQYENAANCYRRALELNPDFSDAHNNLGMTLQSLNQTNNAMASFQQALKITPGHPGALNNLGNTLRDLGRIDEAVECWRQVLKSDSEHMEAAVNYVTARKISADDENFSALASLYESVQSGSSSLSDDQKVSLNFALGKCYEDTQNYEKAFLHFSHGGRLKRASVKYDASETTQLVEQIMRSFDANTITRLHGNGDSSDLPIFVLGMPRSGTTLIEQIISSHREVHGAGELIDMISIMHNDIADTQFPDNLQLIDQPLLSAWSAQYVAGLKRHAPDMQRITDKAPINFLAIGLIHLMLPHAKIIHVSRNPADTCLSCFTQLFNIGQEYTYDLTELGLYYRDYSRLMQHWRETLPAGAFLDVQYEDVVADTETQSRRILEYCGLDWDEACLEFYKNKREVQTASNVQVRQPIYRSSMQRWKNFEAYLAPLLDALGDLARK